MGSSYEVGEVVAKHRKKCLMVTSSGSSLEPARDKIKKLCQDAGVEVYLYNGVLANPTTDMVNKGAKIAINNNVDVVLGLGGGSAIDVTKAIAVGATYEGGAWFYRIDPFEKNKMKLIKSKTVQLSPLQQNI